MDLNDVLKSAPHLQTIATTIVAGVPLAEIVKRIVLPSADALGERMKKRVERCFEKTTKMIEDAGLTPQAVEDKLVVEILRGASLEDNEDLHTMWAALLANAASPENANLVRPGCIATLEQLAPDETMILSWIFKQLDPLRDVNISLQFLYSYFGFGEFSQKAETRLRVCLGGLESVGLVGPFNWESGYGFSFDSEGEEPNFWAGSRPLKVTPRGVEFVLACRPPKPKE